MGFAMDDLTKIRFEELEKRLSAIDKRMDDMKTYFSGVTGVFTIIFSVLTIVLGWNYTNEKNALHDSLKEMKEEMKEELGKAQAIPDLQLLGLDKQPLNGQEVPVSFEYDGGGTMIVIRHVLKNSGSGLTGPMYAKLYTSDPVVLHDGSSDEPAYKYEANINPSNLTPSEIPGQYSTNWTFRIYVERKPPNGKYGVALKVFYGKGLVSKAQFKIVVAEPK